MKILSTAYRYIITLLVLLAGTAGEALAFPAESYATSSLLASGHVVKVSVQDDGFYFIPNTKLREWGFGNPDKVTVYGYGGRRLPDFLSQQNYRDDLAAAPCFRTQNGIIFYGLGTYEIKLSNDNNIYLEPNDYSTAGYYFLKESDSELPSLPNSGTPYSGADIATTGTGYAHHELERTLLPNESGPHLVGEDFRSLRNHNFALPTVSITDGPAWLRCSVLGNFADDSGLLSFKVNKQELSPNNSDRIARSPHSKYVYGSENVSTHNFNINGSTAGRSTTDVSVTFSGDPAGKSAWLNALSLNYTVNLTMPSSGTLLFMSQQDRLGISNAGKDAIILDVTSPYSISRIQYALDGSNAGWDMGSNRLRIYAACKPEATLPSPAYAGKVSNQDLHADRDFDMVIISPAEFLSAAERLAELHRKDRDSLTVKVVTPELIYNEFGSGSPDPGAFRRYFKMLYDRGGDHRIKYAVLMARATLDNRRISTSVPSYPTLPAWMPRDARTSMSDNDGFSSDDITAMLEDGSGANMYTDRLSIAIGRIPVLSARDAANAVDKINQYAHNAPRNAWKQRFLFLADDQDNGVHLKQSESMISQFADQPGQQQLLRKVYMDAYPFVGTNFPGARSDMYRFLNEGVVWWNFIGHANTAGWTADQQLSYSDLNSLYLRQLPFIYAATCDFTRFDGANISGGEIMYNERYGGCVGIISAIRPVYISDNGDLTNAMGRALATRDSRGNFLTPGEMYRRAKNDIRDAKGDRRPDGNRLRYNFIGDPALRLAIPSNQVYIDSIDGLPMGGEMPELKALAKVQLAGSVRTPMGEVMDGFNGTVIIELLDAERSRTTLGRGKNGTQENFEDYGERVYCGSAKVANGKFSLSIAMPGELSQNYRPATLSMYAYASDSNEEAAGLERRVYAYGIQEPEKADTEAPVIESLVLNHSKFGPGETVNASPMLIAQVSDNVSINMSTAGVGHQITATVDGRKVYKDLASYYTPSADGAPAGTINYPLSELTAGAHTLSLRVWDTSGNSATQSIDFFVNPELAPQISRVYTDASPAVDHATFYLEHLQPEAMVDFSISVYDLGGALVWSDSNRGRSNGNTATPITWDLTDAAGRRVQRGLYLFRATITADGKTYQTSSQRIAVAAQ